MRRRVALQAVLLGFVFLPALAWGAPDAPLKGAWTAILRGDFEGARTSVSNLLNSGRSDPQTTQIEGWLDEYRQKMAAREELRQQTFEWNLGKAREAYEAGKEYLALTFTMQASAYAADRAAFARDPWVRELTERIRSLAREHGTKDEWSKALTYYSILRRIHEDDEGIKELRDEAARHARISLTYKTRKDLDERIQGVDRRMVSTILRQVQQMYYEEPNFRLMAEGALQNLEAVAGTTKLFTFLDGVANPALRAHFLQRVGELLRDVQAAPRYDSRALRRLFEDVQRLNRESIELPEGLLVVEFVEGALQRLDDYSSMIWPADAQDFSKAMEGRFFGVGIQLSIDEITNRLKVVTPLEASPALEAGVEPDDLIIAVNGESTKGWTTDMAVDNITGPAGTTVTLTLFRPSIGGELTVPLVRRQINLRTVHGVSRDPDDPDRWNYMLDADVGIAYVRLSQFHPESAGELLKALAAAREQGMRGLILDLRMNPGGLLEVAVDTVSLFQRSGRVVSTRGRSDAQEEIPVTGRAPYVDLPLIVLTDEGSASASEILAGALQDHGRSIVLGERTFGKGSVQRVIPLENNARLKLTTALYYLPNGRSPHRVKDATEWGVTPDFALPLLPKELRKILDMQRANYIIHRTRHAPEPAAAEKTEAQLKELEAEERERNADLLYLSKEELKQLDADPYQAPEADPQLETALLQMRVKLASELPWPRQLAAVESRK